MNMADRRVLMVDSRKFGLSALNHLANLSDFDTVITDSGLAEDVANRLVKAGINLRIAEMQAPEISVAAIA